MTERDLVLEARALKFELKEDRTSALCKAVTHKVVTAKTEDLLSAMADEIERLREIDGLLEADDIRDCDKCDLCEDHHG